MGILGHHYLMWNLHILQMMEQLIAPIPVESEKHASSTDNSTDKIKRPAPSSGGCRIEGFVRVKKVKLIAHLVELMHWSHV